MSEELRSIPPQHGSFVITSESVTEGHTDKIADQISDAVLDAILAKEIELQEQGYIAPNGVPANVENVRCACETLVPTGTVIVAGEIRAQAYVDVQEIARGVIRRIGYNRAKFGFDCDTCGVMSLIHEQSPDIAQGVDESFETQTGATTDPIDLLAARDAAQAKIDELSQTIADNQAYLQANAPQPEETAQPEATEAPAE